MHHVELDLGDEGGDDVVERLDRTPFPQAPPRLRREAFAVGAAVVQDGDGAAAVPARQEIARERALARMIAASADTFFGHFLDEWTNDPASVPADVRAAYLKASREAVPSIVADYRASATVDVSDDRADRDAGNRLRMPVTVLQQDWGAALGFDAAARWRAWAPDLEHRTVSCGHFMAEEAPGEVVKALRDLLAR